MILYWLTTTCYTKFEANNFLEFFNLQSAVDLEIFAWVVWAPTFYGYAKFEVKNFLEFFNLQITLDSKFFRGGVFAPTFFGHA